MPTRRDLLRLALFAAAPVACTRRPWPGFHQRPAYDVCVVGSGFAGTFLALRLVERGVRTVLLEGGPAADRRLGRGVDGRTDLFPCRSVGGIDYPVAQSRTLALGGTSHKWTGVVGRLLPEDLRAGRRHGGTGWPFPYQVLRPYYCQAEQALEAHGQRWQPGEPPRDCPYPVEGDGYEPPRAAAGGRALRFFPMAFSRRRGGPVCLAEEELPRFASTPGATLLADHPVVRLVAPDGERVDHVEVALAGGVERLRARSFVVAAGVLESARLLLLSRDPRHPGGLGNDHDLVGRHLVEHPDQQTVWRGTPTPPLPPGVHRSYDLSEGFRAAGLAACSFQLQDASDGTLVRGQPGMEARPANRLGLDAQTHDVLGRPGGALALDFSPRDWATMQRCLAVQGELAGSLGLDPVSPVRRRPFRFHPSGTCRMADHPTAGVVDADLRVFGMENLFVAGAAAFPDPGTANPTLTVVALSLRLGDHLAGLYRPT